MAFIEFNGMVTPCCWIVTSNHEYESLKEFMAEDFEKIMITNDPEVITEAYRKLEASWATDKPFKTCQSVCGENNHNHPLGRLLDQKIN